MNRRRFFALAGGAALAPIFPALGVSKPDHVVAMINPAEYMVSYRYRDGGYLGLWEWSGVPSISPEWDVKWINRAAADVIGSVNDRADSGKEIEGRRLDASEGREAVGGDALTRKGRLMASLEFAG